MRTQRLPNRHHPLPKIINVRRTVTMEKLLQINKIPPQHHHNKLKRYPLKEFPRHHQEKTNLLQTRSQITHDGRTLKKYQSIYQ
jgi:hypothetical protein